MLLDASFLSGAKVGIARYIEKISEHLATQCRLTVLTSAASSFNSRTCEIVTVPTWTRHRLAGTLWELGWIRALPKRGFDVLVCPTPICPPLAGAPVISVVHDLTPLIIRRGHSAKAKALFWTSMQTLRHAAAIVCDSRSTLTDLSQLQLVPREKLHVVPPGPGLTPIGSQPGPPFPYVLYVGGLPPHKNVGRLLRAFRLLNAKQLNFVVVGWGKKRHIDAAKRMARMLDLHARVTFLSGIADSELSALYRHCRAFIYPSLYEGFGLPVLEALAHGAPVACSRTSSIPEIAGSAAIYFDPLSVTDIAEKLQLLCDDT